MRNRDMPALAGQTLKMSAELPGVVDHIENHGLTKPETAAIAAMQGLLAGEDGQGAKSIVAVADACGITPTQAYAQAAVNHANALFDELDGDKT